MPSAPPRRVRPPRRALWLAGTFALAAVAAFPAVTIGAGLKGAANEKVRICHATRSEANPYVEQEPAIGNNGDLSGGHLDHEDDIIRPYTYVDVNGETQTFPGQNWDAEGQ